MHAINKAPPMCCDRRTEPWPLTKPISRGFMYFLVFQQLASLLFNVHGIENSSWIPVSAALACDVVLALPKLRTIRSTRPPTPPEALAHFIILLLVRTLLVCTIVSLPHILIVRFYLVAVSVLF